MILKAVAIFLGGGLGSICRWLVAMGSRHWLGNFPMHTLIANFFASLILGITIAFFANVVEKPAFGYPFIVVGFCGGFSTFSTFSADTFQLLQAGNILIALLNIFISVGICLGAIALGFYLFKSA